MTLLRDITSGDRPKVLERLRTSPDLARQAVAKGATRAVSQPYFLKTIFHYVYAGDTALHVAAAAHDATVARALVEHGAALDAVNRMGAAPLHYAADAGPGSPYWNADAQRAIVEYLIEAGADPNAGDKRGVAPLHRAVRTRNGPAVRALLEHGANPRLANGNGSTPLDLATQNTGRGGSGSAAAKAQQAEIIALLRRLTENDQVS